MILSVIMSVFNSSQFLEQSIKSILNQSFKDFEFLIIDDCSNDDSVKIIDYYRKKDYRIIFLNNSQNKGLTKNLNNLIYLAKGKYIARMDADDISLPNRLEEQINFFENNPEIDIVGTFSENISEKGEIKGQRKVPVPHKEIVKLLPKLNPISHPTVMFKASSIKKINGYDERFKTSQDYYLWYKALSHGLKFHNIPKVLFQYRMNDDYSSRKSFKYRWNEFMIKLNGYNLINYHWYKYHNALISLALALTPPFLFSLLKKLDPR